MRLLVTLGEELAQFCNSVLALSGRGKYSAEIMPLLHLTVSLSAGGGGRGKRQQVALMAGGHCCGTISGYPMSYYMI